VPSRGTGGIVATRGETVVITTPNITKVIKKMKELNMDFSSLEDPIRQAGKMGLAAVKSYPTIGNWQSGQITSAKKRPGSKYKRTFALQKSWLGRIQTRGRDLASYVIYQKNVMNPKRKKSAKEYMKYVQGSEQTAAHSPYWNTLDYWREELPSYVTGIFDRWAKKNVKKFS